MSNKTYYSKMVDITNCRFFMRHNIYDDTIGIFKDIIERLVHVEEFIYNPGTKTVQMRIVGETDKNYVLSQIHSAFETYLSHPDISEMIDRNAISKEEIEIAKNLTYYINNMYEILANITIINTMVKHEYCSIIYL